MSVEQKTKINLHAKFGIASTETLDLLKAVMSCNTIGANHVTFKSVRLAQEVQQAEERVHVEAEGVLRIRKMMLFVFFDHRDIVHHESVP